MGRVQKRAPLLVTIVLFDSSVESLGLRRAAASAGASTDARLGLCECGHCSTRKKYLPTAPQARNFPADTPTYSALGASQRPCRVGRHWRRYRHQPNEFEEKKKKGKKKDFRIYISKTNGWLLYYEHQSHIGFLLPTYSFCSLNA